MEQETPDFPAPVRTVIYDTLPRLTSGKPPDDLNQQFIAKHSHSLNHLMAGE